MKIDIDVAFAYEVDQPTDLLLQIEVAETLEQSRASENLDLSPAGFAPLLAESNVGLRRWATAVREIRCEYTASVVIDRTDHDLAALPATPAGKLTSIATRYLMPSRYCANYLFQPFANSEFAGLEGGARVAAIAEWTENAIAYAPGASDSNTTATETFVSRQGICRDFAHVFIALVRASGIPARFVSCYAPDVDPPDFHAVAEVYLDGSWHLVDASGMAKASETAVIGVGLDAAEVAFLTTFAPARFVAQNVRVTRDPA